MLWNSSSRQRDFNRPPFYCEFRACIVLNCSRFSSFHNANLEPRNVYIISGWQLGEHGEWCKHTNFDMATRIPMMVYVPGVTSKQTTQGKIFPFQDALDKSLRFKPQEPKAEGGVVSDAFVEAVDLYATISELAGLAVPPTCPDNPFNVSFCTEGVSFVRLIKNLTERWSSSDDAGTLTWKPAVFSQYPRPSLTPTHDSINPVLANITVMGYTMRTTQHRYTEWMAYNHTTFFADWNTVYARELYIYDSDPDEDVNVAEVEAFQDLVSTLSSQLRAGWRKALPTTRG